MNKYLPYVRFSRESFHVDLPFSVNVLTEEHRKKDDRVPSPGLSIFESQDLFRLLEKRELVYPHISGESYFLSKIQPSKWDELISKLGRPSFTFTWWFKGISALIIFILSAALGGFVGGFFNKTGEDLATMNPVIEISPVRTEIRTNPNGENKGSEIKKNENEQK